MRKKILAEADYKDTVTVGSRSEYRWNDDTGELYRKDWRDHDYVLIATNKGGHLRQMIADFERDEPMEIGKFRTSTIGLWATHENLKWPTIIRVDVHDANKNQVALLATSGRNLSRIKCIPTVFVDLDEYENSPDSPYDDTVFARWALGKCGVEILGYED